MKEKLEQLIEVSRKYGSDKRYVIAGGGNTSYKNDAYLWIKASGHAMATITENGFSQLDRKKLNIISEKSYSTDADQREAEVKADLHEACITKDRRPSVETSMHNVFDYAFVVHLHPTDVNGLMCSRNAAIESNRLFDDSMVFIPYTDPGYRLFKEVETRINDYKMKTGKHPSIVLLQNHGIFVCADTVEEIDLIYHHVMSTIEKQTNAIPTNQDEDGAPDIIDMQETIPAIRMMLSRQGNLKSLKIRNNTLITKFASKASEFDKAAVPFTPDVIVYCKSKYIYLSEQNKEDLLKEAQKKISEYVKVNRYTPKVLVIKGIGLVAVGDNAADCDIILDVYEDMMKVAEIAQSFGGEQSMDREQINFIDNWEVENYRRKVSSGSASGRVHNKIIIITGAAQGFGEGIAECLLKEGANVVVADLNESVGRATVERLSSSGLLKSVTSPGPLQRGSSGDLQNVTTPGDLQRGRNNRVIFVKTDVTDRESLNNLIKETVSNFGGLDVFISNAGVLRAGSLEDFEEDVFEFVTKINYHAYFYCAQAALRIMKIQNEYAPDNYGDIIQINSKSGLRGSKANFAYAGSKFGGIGLTQSFALELAPFRIKVNAICPGNFYEGPLWSDPDSGLFKQYLQTGKAKGAKTIDDVRNYYISQVPMQKGTSPADVTKAILYLIDQNCETGQALPVTGGQVMIS